MRMSKPGKPRIQCENCSARNPRVKLVTLTKVGKIVGHVNLCEACVRIASKLVGFSQGD